MKIYNDIKDVTKDMSRILTIGTFDGVHLGHKKILDVVKEKAKLHNGRSFVITFEPHPREVISSLVPVQLITSFEEKLVLLEEYGIDEVLVIKFTHELSKILAKDFFLTFLYNGVGFKEIVTGYDHRFGKGREGDKHKLREWGSEYGYEVTHIEKVSIEGIGISSSQIRTFISEGKVSETNLLLGRDFSFSGKIVFGDKRGRELGFPTANIGEISKNKIMPALGVYSVEVITDSFIKNGVMNVGIRPTFNSAAGVVAEVNIFDFTGEIYGENITVRLLSRLRGEKKFLSKDDLIKQIQADKDSAKMFFEQLNN